MENPLAVLAAEDAPTVVLDSGASENGASHAPTRRAVTLYTDTELEAMPATAWTIDGVLPANALAVLVGERSTLKTFLMLGMAAHVWTGLEWNGRRVTPGEVVYVYAEGRSGITARLTAWKKYHQVESLGVLFLPHSLIINDGRDCAALLAAIEERIGTRRVALIVVDTYARNSSGNENSAEDMSAFVRGADLLRERTGGTVLVVHHKGHGEAERGRGSSVLEGAADTLMFVSRDEDRVTIECKKQKDGPEFLMIAMEAVPVAGSLMLKPSGLNSGELKGQRLHCLTQLHQNSTDDGMTHRSWLELTELAKSSFSKAVKWLRANGYAETRRGRWHVTDAGHIRLNGRRSTQSTASPPPESGLPETSPLHLGGSLDPQEWTNGKRQASCHNNPPHD